MTEQDPWSEVRDLTDVAGQSVTPMSSSRIRTLGARRRRRRHLAVGAVGVALAVGLGGGLFTQTVNRAAPERPPIASTPTPAKTATPVPPRGVTLDNVITTKDLVKDNAAKGTWQELTDNARDADEVSACQQATFASLGATSQAGRSFRFSFDGYTPAPGTPHADEPTEYVLALQFPDAATAEKAYTTYRTWVDECPSWLTSRDYGLVNADRAITWVDAPVDQGSAEFAMNVYRLPSEKKADPAYWETVGLLLDGDRMAVTVGLHYTNEYQYSNVPGGEPGSGMAPDHQFSLLAKSSRVLQA